MLKYIIFGTVAIGVGAALYYVYRLRQENAALKREVEDMRGKTALFRDFQHDIHAAHTRPPPQMEYAQQQPPQPPQPVVEMSGFGAMLQNIAGGDALSAVMNLFPLGGGGGGGHSGGEAATHSLYDTAAATEPDSSETQPANEVEQEVEKFLKEESEDMTSVTPAEPLLRQSQLEKMNVPQLQKIAKKHNISIQTKDDKGKPRPKRKNELIQELSTLCNPEEEIQIVQ